MKAFFLRFRILLLVIAVCCIAGLVSLWTIFYGGNDFPDHGERIFFVSRGESFSSVVDSLEAQGIIRSRAMFGFVVRLLGGAERVQVGKYSFLSGVSNAEIFLTLRSGKKNLLIHVTIPEGSRIRLQARIFARALGIDSARYAGLAFDSEFVRSRGIDHSSLEGYLLPDTYGFYWEQDEREILKRQVENFDRFFNDTLRNRAAVFGWDVHKTVTFASIVEGEAVLDEERPIIAGVYHNRLHRGMRLEADPTIQYTFGDRPRRVLYADLAVDNPYNTYRNPGLPPGPVNNPGREAILASLYPSEHGFLYFVANRKGGHWFTRTYADHLRYVRMYRLQRRRDMNGG